LRRIASSAVATRVVDEPGGKALLLTYRVKRSGGKPVNVYQYAFDAGAQAYVVTFAVPAQVAKRYTKAFAKSAASFSF